MFCYIIERLLQIAICLYRMTVRISKNIPAATKRAKISYVFCVVKTVHFGIKLYNDQGNAQVFNLFISALHVSGFLLTHLQRQMYKSDNGLSLQGIVSALGH
jgi:hypothetical protein